MRIFASLAIVLFAFTTATIAKADQLIVNGGFEAGLAGWTTTSTGDGSFSVTSATSTPLTGNATVGAHGGTYYAVSDDYDGSQTQYLTQAFTTPASLKTATLSFSMFVNDVYGADFGSSGPGAKVSLLSSTGNLIALLFGPVDTIENPVGSPDPYVPYSADISSYLTSNTQYRLQFSSADISGPFNVGVDDVSLITTSNTAVTPEPSTFVLLLSGGMFAFLLAYRRAA